VETLLETRESNGNSGPRPPDPIRAASQQQNYSEVPSLRLPESENNPVSGMISPPSFVDPSLGSMIPEIGLGVSDDFSWEMIGLGLEEPLPSQDVIDDM
jgi:hypothetical protein